ncbi:MAG TPA: sigma-70 family RNA polymerase sigma factor [Polyangiaceae bacterium]|nr:sigma-70 family RNA polymerase sigma factor [Polyangiaceae bacterium]
MTGDASPPRHGGESPATSPEVAADRFEAEFLPSLPSLLAVAARLTGTRSEAEDLVQDTLLKAYRSRKQYRAGTNPRAWLMAILRNTFLNGYRRRNLERRVFDGPDADALAPGWVGASSLRAIRDPHSGALHSMLEAPLLTAIDELPAEFKMTVQLADIEELSYREIAESMSCPIGTVMSRLHRGRRWLRARLLSEAEAIGLVDESAATPAAAGKAGADAKTAKSTAKAEPEAGNAPVELSRYRQKKGARG